MSVSPPTSPQRARRPSRFIEGSAVTRPDLLQRTPTSNELLFNILSEMDEFEKKRKHRDSNSSIESLHSNGALPSPIVGKQESRRSFGTSRHSIDEKERSLEQEKRAHGLKGRLRALTGGKEREQPKETPFHGT